MMNSTSQKLQEVQSVIIALLTAEKKTHGIDVVKFDQIYREAECEHIPFRKLGYSSLASFLQTISGVEVQSRNGGHVINFYGKESTRHLSQLVAKQRSHISKNYRGRSASCRPIASHYISRSRVVSPRRYNDVADEILGIVQRYPKGLTKSELLKIYLQRHPSSNFDSQKLLHQLRLLEVKVMVRENMVYPARNPSSCRNLTPRSKSIPPRIEYDVEWKASDVNESQTIPSNFKVIPDSPGGCEDDDWIDDNNFDYVTPTISNEKQFDVSVTLKNTSPNKTPYNFVENTVIKACENNELEENLPVKSPIQNKLQMESQPEKKTFNEDDFIFSKSQEHVAALLNKRIQFRLEKLIQNNPDGIWCIDLPKKYLEEYKISLDWENFGFQRIGDFAAYLPHIFHLVGPFRNGDLRLYDAKLPVPTGINKFNKKPEKSTLASLYNVYNSEDEVEAVPLTIPLSLSNQLVPDGIMVNGETVGQILVTDFNIHSEISKGNSLIAVRVVEAFSPSFFWIHIEKKRNKFDNMMNDLQIFYEAEKAKYSIPIIILEKGLNVACMFFDKWHRGIIKAIDHRCQVTVLFYDYGTVKTYPPDHVFYLHRKFSGLQAQAIPCGLYGMRPLEGDVWPKHVIDSFIKRVYDRPLWATIGKLDADTNSMLVSLTDTSQDNDFHIIDWMFDRKYAKPGHMEIIDPKDLSHYVEDYGDTQEVYNDYENERYNQLLDNVVKLSPDVSTVAIENLLSALTVAQKKSNIVMSTIDCLDHLQNLLQTITLRYFEMILNMHGVMNPEILTNMSEALVKIILDAVRSELTIVEPNNVNTLDATKLSIENQIDNLKLNGERVNEATTNQSDLLDVELINNDELNDVNNIPMQSDISNGPETINTKQSAHEHLIDPLLTEDKLKIDEVNEVIENMQQLNTDTMDKTKAARRAQLESSITNVCDNFFQRHERAAIPNNSDVKQHTNFDVEELNDTNPFKKYIMLNMNSFESLKVSPPLPPKDTKIVEGNLIKSSPNFINDTGVKIVYEAPPVFYDLPKNNITYKSPVKTEFKLAETMHLKNIQSKCIEECQEICSKTIGRRDISPDDDKGFQSGILSSTWNDSVLQQKTAILIGELDILHSNSQVNSKETVTNDYVSVQESSEKSLLFIKLTHNIVCIFCIQQEGWIPINHFRSTFTTFGDNDILFKFINITSITDIKILNLKRAHNLPLFNRYESRMFNWMPKNHLDDRQQMPVEYNDLTLINLSSITNILIKMYMITEEESDALRRSEVLETHPVPQASADVAKLFKIYRSFRQQQS